MCPRRVSASWRRSLTDLALTDLSTRSSNEKTWKRARRQVERSTRATTDADRGPDGFVFKTVSSQTRNFRCDHACSDGGVACVRTSAGRAASGSPRPERAAGCRAAGLYRSAAGARIQDWAGAALRPACPYLRGDGDITAVAVPGMIPARLAGSCPMLPAAMAAWRCSLNRRAARMAVWDLFVSPCVFRTRSDGGMSCLTP